MIEEVIIAALWYALAGYFSVASANKIPNKRLGWWGRVFYCQSLLKVLIVSLLHPPLPPQTSSPRHEGYLQLPPQRRPWKERSGGFTPGWLAVWTFKKVTFISYCFSIVLKWVEGQCGSSEGCGNNWDIYWASVRRGRCYNYPQCTATRAFVVWRKICSSWENNYKNVLLNHPKSFSTPSWCTNVFIGILKLIQ